MNPITPPPPEGKGFVYPMTNCKVKLIVMMENVPEDKKEKLMERIDKNVRGYPEVLDCDLDISVSGCTP